MSYIRTNWLAFANWLKSLRVPSTAPQASNPFQEQRDTRRTIRVNLTILEEEIAELDRVAKIAAPSAAVTQAKTLLDLARSALLLDGGIHGLINATSEELEEILTEVFRAMRQSNAARRLLNACRRI